MNRKKISLIAILFMSAMLAGIMGCGEKKTGVIGFAMRDDGEQPAQPQDLNYVVNNIYTGHTESHPDNYYFRVRLSWSPVTTNIKGKPKENIVGYKIYRNGRNPGSIIGMTDRNTTTFVDACEDLKHDTQQVYYVSAYDSLMRESFSTSLPVKIEIGGSVPNSPRDLFLIPGKHSIMLSWTKPLDSKDPVPHNDQIVGYLVRRRTDVDRTFEDLAIVMGSDQTYYQDGNLSEGVRYFYTVQAITRIGNQSKPTLERAMTVANLSMDPGYAATAPDNPQVSIEGTSALITWDDPLWLDSGSSGQFRPNVMGYYIYRAELTASGGMGRYILIKVINRVNSWTDTDIDSTKPAGHYWYRISAFDDAGNEGDKSVATSDISSRVPETPRGFNYKVEATTSRITLEWTYASGMRYNIYESNNGRWFDLRVNQYDPVSDHSGLGDGDKVQYDIGAISQGQTKYFKLSAVNNVNRESNKTYFIRVSRAQEWIYAQYTVPAEQFAPASRHNVRHVFEAAGRGEAWITDKWLYYWDGEFSGYNWNYTMYADSISLPSGESVSALRFQPYQPYGNAQVPGVPSYDEGTGPNEDVINWHTGIYGHPVGPWNVKAYEWDGNGNARADDSPESEWDNFQDQFRFWWTVPHTGTYDIEIYFVKSPRNGAYRALLRTDDFVVGSAQDIFAFVSTDAEMTLSNPASDGGRWSSVSLEAGDKLYFVFNCVAPRRAVPTTHTGGHHDYFWDTELLVDRIEIERTDI